MSGTVMLCANCGRHHCCDYRPMPDAVTSRRTVVKDTLSNTSTVMTPFESKSTAFNEYQLNSNVLNTSKKILRRPAPNKITFDRPKSDNTHYLFRKKPQNLGTNAMRQVPNIRRGVSPSRQVPPAPVFRHSPSPPVTVRRTGSPISTRMSIVGASPHSPRATITRQSVVSPTVAFPKQTGRISSPFQQRIMYTATSKVVTTNPPVLIQPTILVPPPSSVMISQRGSKVGHSCSTNLTTSKICSQKDNKCTYHDRRCLGFDFGGDTKNQLCLDNTGHKKDYLHV